MPQRLIQTDFRVNCQPCPDPRPSPGWTFGQTKLTKPKIFRFFHSKNFGKKNSYGQKMRVLDLLDAARRADESNAR